MNMTFFYSASHICLSGHCILAVLEPITTLNLANIRQPRTKIGCDFKNATYISNRQKVLALR